MNGNLDVIEVLQRVNPVPPGTIDESVIPIAAELRASLRAPSTTVPTFSLDQPASHGRRSWPKYAAAAAALAAGIAAFSVILTRQDEPVVPATTPDTTALPTTTTPPTGPFVGVWVSTDTDGSSQSMEILYSGIDERQIVVRDDAATDACSGAPSTMTGIGRLETDEVLVIARPELTCDDGTTPMIGPPPQPELANFTFDRDPATDELVDQFAVVWRPEGSEGAGDAASPAPTLTVPPTADDAPTAVREGVVRRLVEAIDAAAADSRNAQSLPDVFTEDAVVSPDAGWEASPRSELDRLGDWIAHLQAWGFEADFGECWIEAGLVCTVRGRWNAVLAESDEYWNVDFVGDRIQALTIHTSGQRFGDPGLPLSLAELDDWEDWLQQTDPQTAARLIPEPPAARPFPGVPRYDPALADEITASIRLYLTQRPPGDEISVTADRVEFGDRLVGLIGNMDRADGRTYVIAGRYQTDTDLMFAPDEAVLAAFDDAGTELWRTELDGTPVAVVAVAGDVWVLHSAGRLSRINASNGRVVGQTYVGDVAGMVGAFESLWLQIGDGQGNTSQLIRVDPDLSTATVELPAHDLRDADEWFFGGSAAAGAGAIWVPMGDGGVAVIDPDTLAVTVIPVDAIGHRVEGVAFDGDVAYVASRNQVTSIVDGEVRATTSTGEIRYLGHVDGVFGVEQAGGRFTVLSATDPMVVEVRQVSETGAYREIDGEAWAETGLNYDLRRAELLPVPEAGGG